MNEDQVRQIANHFIRDEIQPKVAEELVISNLEEFRTCWVATCNSRKFIETGSIRYMLAGNGPLIINKRTGAVRLGVTSAPVEEQLDSE
jgi:Immunity protein 35